MSPGSRTKDVFSMSRSWREHARRPSGIQGANGVDGHLLGVGYVTKRRPWISVAKKPLDDSSAHSLGGELRCKRRS